MRRQWLIFPLLLLYLLHLGGVGFLGPDEPRYASIGRAMAHSGDWITPRLDGDPWFENHRSLIGLPPRVSARACPMSGPPAFRNP